MINEKEFKEVIFAQMIHQLIRHDEITNTKILNKLWNFEVDNDYKKELKEAYEKEMAYTSENLSLSHKLIHCGEGKGDCYNHWDLKETLTKFIEMDKKISAKEWHDEIVTALRLLFGKSLVK